MAQKRRDTISVCGSPNFFIRFRARESWPACLRCLASLRCNLRCTWCDTPYASWEAPGAINARGKIGRSSCRRGSQHCAQHVVLTGGEPMMFAESAELMAGSNPPLNTPPSKPPARSGFRHSIPASSENTAAAQTAIRRLIDLASISPKLANSRPAEREAGRFAAAHDLPSHQSLTCCAASQRKLAAHSSANASGNLSWQGGRISLAEIEELLQRINAGLPSENKTVAPGCAPDARRHRRRRPFRTLRIWLAELCKQAGYRFCPRLHVLLYGNKRGT